MAAGDRTDSIVSQAQFALAGADQSALTKIVQLIPPTLLYDKVALGATRLAVDHLCIEKSASLTFSSGSASEPTGFLRLKLLALGSSTWFQAQEIDVEEKDAVARIMPSGVGVQFYYRWNGSIVSYPSLSDGTYTAYYYGIPTTTPSTSVDPETPSYMDDALIAYVVKELALVAGRADLVPVYEVKFREEATRAFEAFRRTKSIRNEIHYHDI